MSCLVLSRGEACAFSCHRHLHNLLLIFQLRVRVFQRSWFLFCGWESSLRELIVEERNTKVTFLDNAFVCLFLCGEWGLFFTKGWDVFLMLSLWPLFDDLDYFTLNLEGKVFTGTSIERGHLLILPFLFLFLNFLFIISLFIFSFVLMPADPQMIALIFFLGLPNELLKRNQGFIGTLLILLKLIPFRNAKLYRWGQLLRRGNIDGHLMNVLAIDRLDKGLKICFCGRIQNGQASI